MVLHERYVGTGTTKGRFVEGHPEAQVQGIPPQCIPGTLRTRELRKGGVAGGWNETVDQCPKESQEVYIP